MSGINSYTRKAVKLRDGHKCLHCGSTYNLTVDHVLPISKGGTGNMANLQTLCYRCNQQKDNRFIDYRVAHATDGVPLDSVLARIMLLQAKNDYLRK